MKTPEELLLEYYTWWLEERDKVLKTSVYDTAPCHFGLCQGLKSWLRRIAYESDTDSPVRILQGYLLTQNAAYHDVDGDYPFNVDDDDYRQEFEDCTCHLNPHRVAYVQRMIKELAP